MLTEATKVVIKLEQPYVQTIGDIKRFIGLVKVVNLIDLLSGVGLDANPRSSKTGNVTEAIRESLEVTPETFAVKTKGILIGASSYRELERNRVEIVFEDPELEGILDGGHNGLALGIHLLNMALDGSPKIKKIKTWSDFKDLWNQSLQPLEALRGSGKSPVSGIDYHQELSVLVPVELIVPSDPNDATSVHSFNTSLLDICSARNNNVQLKLDAKANQSGYFDFLKEQLPETVSKRVEWKTNEGGMVKAPDVVALSWISLAKLNEWDTDGFNVQVGPPPPQNIYRSKGDCLDRFNSLMGSDKVTRDVGGKSELLNSNVKSALVASTRLPEVYDWVQENLPAAYNRNGGRFGGIRAVSKANPANRRTKPTSKFYGRVIDTSVPDGFVVPFVVGMGQLLETDSSGAVGWKLDPIEFLTKNFDKIVGSVKDLMDILQLDPQRFGKERFTYDTIARNIESQLR